MNCKWFIPFIMSALVTALLAGILYWPALFQGKVIVPGDMPTTNQFFSDPPRPAQNDLLFDQLSTYMWQSMAASVRKSEGRTPLWNPHIYTGQPLVANAQSGLFYPPNLLLGPLSAGKVATIRVFFNLIVAGIFTCLFCIELGISAAGATLAAITFTYSGPLTVWLGHPHANVLVWLPFMMWAGERLLRRPTFSRVAILGAGMGAAILGGHPETTFHVWLIFLLYIVARVFLCKELSVPVLKMAGLFVLAGSLGVALGAIQLFPFVDFMLQSATFAQGGRSLVVAGSNLLYSPDWLAHLSTVITAICPNFFGNPLDMNYIWPFSLTQNYSEQAIYFGTIPFALAFGSLLGCSRERTFFIIGFLAIFCLAVALRTPVFEAVNHLPILSMANNSRLKLPCVFLAAILAGKGLDTLGELLAVRRFRGKFIYAILGILLMTLVLYFVIMMMMFLGDQGILSSSSADGFLNLLLNNVFSGRAIKSYIPLASVITVAVVSLSVIRSKRHHGIVLWTMIIISGGELSVLGRGYNYLADERKIFPELEAVRLMKGREKQPFRILATDWLFEPNYNVAYGIDSVGGYDQPVDQHYEELYQGQQGEMAAKHGPGWPWDVKRWEPGGPLEDFLNVRYIITASELKPERYVPIMRTSGYSIYENKDALPRAYIVHNAEFSLDRQATLKRMTGGNLDFRKSVILEGEPYVVPFTGHGTENGDGAEV
ncbi:MAG: hypothetical protein HXX17_10400, partial [Geobacteraceae bacterium]|nr:hypothetical protein [Geobacteraceae bacterium]